MYFQTEQDILDGFLFNGKVSKKKLDYLETEFDQGLQAVPKAVSLMTADSLYCQELDLQAGSYWIQVIAELLDHLRPTNDIWTRLNFLNKALETHGHIEAAEE
tara:strand:- start:586 stop:894 length:309 start_codon:yes stop_codon:yes gene_type:complete